MGYGKTTLAAHVFHHLAQHKTSDNITSPSMEETGPVVLAYFFSRNKQDYDQLALEALKTVTHQLVQKRPMTLRVLLDRFDQLSVSRRIIWSWPEIVAVLRHMINTLASTDCVYIILDDIDRCEMSSQAKLIRWMRTIVDESSPMIHQRSGPPRKIFATSRPNGKLSDLKKAIPILDIHPVDTNEDVHRHIEDRVGESGRHRHVPLDIVRKISDTLHHNAEGLFLWVDWIMADLKQRKNRLSNQSITSTLGKLHPILADSYQSTIMAPPTARREDLWRILRWLLYSSPRVTLAQLEVAMCAEHGFTSWYGFSDDFDFLCGPLVNIDRITGEISLVHKTAWSFLKTFILHATPVELCNVDMDVRKAHEHLASVCIQHLLEQDAQLQRLENRRIEPHHIDRMEEFLRRNPFTKYAIEGWAYHTRGSGRRTLSLSSRLLIDTDRRAGLMNLIYFIKYKSPWIPNAHERIHLAAYFNVPELIELYITEGMMVDVSSDGIDTPLIWASETGSTESVKVLLDAGANPNQFETGGWSALHWAARHGHQDVAVLLLNHGAEPHHRNRRGQTPLDWAVDREHWRLVYLLHQGSSEGAMKLATSRSHRLTRH